MSVDIIDLGSGNVRSVQHALSRLHMGSRIVGAPREIKASTVLLPGVGSAGPYMGEMVRRGFAEAIRDLYASGTTILGICLGFQLMAQGTEEDGGVEGLGLIEGQVTKVQGMAGLDTHNGWEPFSFRKDMLRSVSYQASHHLTRKQVVRGRVFYNHEYGLPATNATEALPIESASFGAYTSMVVRKNLVGMQFHPEKSQQTGLDVLAMVL